MAQNDVIHWAGFSGVVYPYWFVGNIAGLQSVGGNYAFVKRLPNGKVAPLYFGETNDLSKRIPNHDMWSEAARLGATHVMGHTTPAGERARLDEERDLIRNYNPVLNVQHRTTG